MAEVAEREAKTTIVVQPFGIEADHPHNSDLLLQSIPGQRLRSRITSSRTAKNVKTGAETVPIDQSTYLGQFPMIPGMQLHVDPAKLTYTIIDPLEGDKELCEKIQRAMRRVSEMHNNDEVRGMPVQRGTLDVHRMKTLVREMCWLLDGSEAKVVKGGQPTAEQVERLPGNFLLNPGSRVPNSQPTFEKDFDSWREQLTRAGG